MSALQNYYGVIRKEGMIRKEGYPEVCDASRGTCKSLEVKQRAEELLTVVLSAVRRSSGNLVFVYFRVKVFPAGTGIVCLCGARKAAVIHLPPSPFLCTHAWASYFQTKSKADLRKQNSTRCQELPIIIICL